MELDSKDHVIVNLLAKLKNGNDVYPSDLLASRRQKYIQRVSEIGVGLGVSAGLMSTIKSGKGGALTTTAGGLLETAILFAIIVEVGAAAYSYRDKIAQIIQSYAITPKVQEVTSPPEFSSPLPELNTTEAPAITETLTTTETPTGTAILVGVTNDNNNASNQAVSTLEPNGNNGNHFGQTPRPDPREGNNSGNNNGNDRGGGNDK